MKAEDRFAADKIHLVLGAHYNHQGRWWGQAAHTEDGITVKVEAYGETATDCVENLWAAWEAKVNRVPNFIPRLAPPIEDASFLEVLDDSIPF